MQPGTRPDGTAYGAADFFRLFEPAAPWRYTAGRTDVFKIYLALLRDASDEQLRAVIDGLAFRHIALAVELPVLADTVRCRPGAKHARWMLGPLQRLRELGGDLRFVAMVGPLVDGHVSEVAGSCRASIPEVAEDAAATIAAVRRLFPLVQVGDIEPVGGRDVPTPADFAAWFTAFQRASGQSLAFLHMDTVWGEPWRDGMRGAAEQARLARVPFGVIYKGEHKDLSDQAFAEDALAHSEEVETLLGHAPDQVIVQSWQDYPRRALPDDDLTSMTGILRAYLRPRSRLEMLADGRIRLTELSGRPIAGAPIEIQQNEWDPGRPLVVNEISGTVPHGARGARLALRLHTECICASVPIEIAIGDISFAQPGLVQAQTWNLDTWARPGASLSAEIVLPGRPAYRLQTNGTARVVLNGPVFPVMPDRPFVARFGSTIAAGTPRSGFFAVIFVDEHAIEIRRTSAWLVPSWRGERSLRTDSDGETGPIGLPAGSRRAIRLVYPGGFNHRPADFILAPPARSGR